MGEVQTELAARTCRLDQRWRITDEALHGKRKTAQSIYVNGDACCQDPIAKGEARGRLQRDSERGKRRHADVCVLSTCHSTKLMTPLP